MGGASIGYIDLLTAASPQPHAGTSHLYTGWTIELPTKLREVFTFTVLGEASTRAVSLLKSPTTVVKQKDVQTGLLPKTIAKYTVEV